MNILILSWRGIGHPRSGGAEISTHEHAKGWVKAGHKVILFTSIYPHGAKEEILDGVAIKRSGSEVLGVQIEALKWYFLENKIKFDLVIDQFHGIPFFTPFYVKPRKLAFIHEVAKEVWSLNPWPWPFKLIPTIIGTLGEPLIFRFYQKMPFMTVSDSTKKELEEWGIPEENITVINNGVEKLTVEVNGEKNKQKTLIFLGALTKDKGAEDVVEIFSKINSKNKDYTFWLVGKGEQKYTNFLKLKARKLGLEGKVKFWGFVSSKLKYELLNKAHILINPSIREGWGLVVLEAASVGTPTIGYNVSGLKDSVVNGKTGILVEKNNLNQIVNEVLSIMKDEKRYNRYSQDAKNWSKNFSWEKAVEKSLKLLEKVSS